MKLFNHTRVACRETRAPGRNMVLVVPQEVTQPGRNVKEEIAFLLPLCGLILEINDSEHDRKREEP